MEWIDSLEKLLNRRTKELAEQIRGSANAQVKVPPMTHLLKTALKNEWETALLTSLWVTDETHADFRIDLARLAGDEARHFSMIETRLNELGGEKDVVELNKRTPLFHFLETQKSTFDRVVTGPFTREALAVARNRVFLEHCQQIGDQKTIEIYESIQADEAHHHQLGKKMLKQLIGNDQEYTRAEEKIEDILQVVDDIQEMAVMKLGVCYLPGC